MFMTRTSLIVRDTRLGRLSARAFFWLQSIPGEGDNPVKRHMTVGDFLVAYLRKAGVRHVFGIPGDLALKLFFALGKKDDLQNFSPPPLHRARRPPARSPPPPPPARPVKSASYALPTAPAATTWSIPSPVRSPSGCRSLSSPAAREKRSANSARSSITRPAKSNRSAASTTRSPVPRA